MYVTIHVALLTSPHSSPQMVSFYQLAVFVFRTTMAMAYHTYHMGDCIYRRISGPRVWRIPCNESILLVPEPLPWVPAIESWVYHRFANAANSNPHYAATLYGPTNTLLMSLFPPRRRMMVKPQGHLRLTMDPNPEEARPSQHNASQDRNGEDGAADNDSSPEASQASLASNLSFDSQGDTVRSRLVGGHGEHID